MFKLLSRKHLSASGLLGVVHSQFKKIKPPRCIDHEQKITKHDPCVIDGLQAILADKSRSNLSKDEKSQIKALVAEHYKTKHPAEDISYYHNMFCAAVVHPDNRIALPLAPEPIMKADGFTKNDCGAPRGAYVTRGESPLRKAVPAASWIELWACVGDYMSYA